MGGVVSVSGSKGNSISVVGDAGGSDNNTPVTPQPSSNQTTPGGALPSFPPPTISSALFVQNLQLRQKKNERRQEELLAKRAAHEQTQESETSGADTNSSHLTNTTHPLLAEFNQLLQRTPEQDKAIELAAREVAAKIEEINDRKQRGEIDERTALDDTVKALVSALKKDGNPDAIKRTAWLEKAASIPSLAAAFCEVMRELPRAQDINNSPDLPAATCNSGFLVLLFAKTINAEFTTANHVLPLGKIFVQWRGERSSIEKFVTERNLSRHEIAALMQARNEGSMPERVERMKAGVEAMVDVLPQLRTPTEPTDLNWLVAIEALAMIHPYANPALKQKIADALGALSMDELDRNAKLLGPKQTVLARERLIGDIDALSKEDQNRLIRMLEQDVDRYGGSPDHFPMLLKNVSQLVDVLPKLQDEELRLRVRLLEARCFTERQLTMDWTARSALLDDINRTMASKHANHTLGANFLRAIAPLWNSALKKLEQDAASLTSDEHTDILKKFNKVTATIYMFSHADRPALLGEFLDGIQALGRIDLRTADLERYKAFVQYLYGTCKPADDEERIAVLKARLAMVNDPTRLVIMLTRDHKHSVPALKQILTEVEALTPSRFLAAELHKLTQDKLDKVLEKVRQTDKLNADQKESAEELVIEFMRRLDG